MLDIPLQCSTSTASRLQIDLRGSIAGALGEQRDSKPTLEVLAEAWGRILQSAEPLRLLDLRNHKNGTFHTVITSTHPNRCPQ